jgi:hypothetical protein
MDQHGLVTFKDRFGAARTTITYFRCSHPRRTRVAEVATLIGRAIVGKMPDAALRAAGRLLYRHAG